MLRIFSILLWTAVFVLIVLAVDQLLLRVPATLPAHAAVATFYRELRGRVLELAAGQPGAPAPVPVAPKPPAAAGKTREAPARPPASVEKVIEQRQLRKATPPAAARKPAEVPAPPPTSVEAVIEQQSTAPATPPANRPARREPAMRYLFADDQGNLHFAGTLAEVPEQYRDKARLVRE